MRRRMTIWAAGLLLALSGAAWAQEASQCTVEPEAIKMPPAISMNMHRG